MLVAIAGRIAQSVEHSANNAAVQGSSPCMTILLTFLASLLLQPRFSPAPRSVVLMPMRLLSTDDTHQRVIQPNTVHIVCMVFSRLTPRETDFFNLVKRF